MCSFVFQVSHYCVYFLRGAVSHLQPLAPSSLDCVSRVAAALGRHSNTISELPVIAGGYEPKVIKWI